MSTETPEKSGGSPQIVLSRATVIAAIAVFVVVAFLAALLGGAIASSRNSEPPAAESTPTPSATAEPDLEDLIAEILPAGADVRAGTGVPSASYGNTGDIYIDLSNSDVYVKRADGWQRVGNIRVDSAENLRGEQGVPGSPGDRGEQGAAGQDGTQVTLGMHTPDADETCEPDGSIYIDTSSSSYFSCVGGAWSLVAPPAEG